MGTSLTSNEASYSRRDHVPTTPPIPLQLAHAELDAFPADVFQAVADSFSYLTGTMAAA
jgi:hypothetical protein